MINKQAILSRRQALKAALITVGGSIGAAKLGSVAAFFESTTIGSARILNPDQFVLVERICDTIIPATDTPGAVAANVHYFIDRMLTEWASDDTRSKFMSGLGEVNQLARESHGSDFAALTADQQLVLLEDLDRVALDADEHPFQLIKRLVVFGYYASEIGATVELRWDPVPGSYGCIPFGPDDRAWATNAWRDVL